MIENPKSLTEQLLNLVERIATEMKALFATVDTKQPKGDYATADQVAGKADKVHVHVIGDVTNLQTELNNRATTEALTTGLAGKAAASHTHAISEVSGLQSALDGKQASGNYVTREVADKLYLGINSKASNAASADSANAAAKLATARTVSVTGDASGSVQFDGSKDVDLSLTVSHASSAAKLETAQAVSLTGDATGTASFDGSKPVSIAVTVT